LGIACESGTNHAVNNSDPWENEIKMSAGYILNKNFATRVVKDLTPILRLGYNNIFAYLHNGRPE